jgi:hypothetical protein
MAQGSYGNIRPADVSPADCEIFYYFTSGRTASALTTSLRFKKLSSEDVLTPIFYGDMTENAELPTNELIGGLYNLKLTSDDFSDLGIYTLHIRPKQIRAQITDCGILASLPSVRGLVIDLSQTTLNDDRNKFVPQGLVGYRIEYLNDDGTKIPNFFRIVTSSFYCTPIMTNSTSTTQKSIRYQYTNNTTNLMFLTLTPSSAPSSKPNTVPSIGQPNQKIIFSNTYFNPVTVEIEMVEHDATTLGHALYGNQSKAISSGIYTIYDNNNNIYKQYNLYEIKDELNETLFEIREERNDIDESLNFTEITQ